MKTAVLISGHMRSFARCLPNQFDHVYRHFPDVDFYVSTVKDADSATVDLLRERFPKSRVEIEILDGQPELPIPVQPIARDWQAGQGRLYGHEPYAISVHPQAVLRQLWHLNRVWEFFVQKDREWFDQNKMVSVIGRYQTIIRMRADNYFRSFRLPLTVGMGAVTPRRCWTPWWGRFGGINDRFALLGTEAARAYFTTFSRVEELLAKGYPLHPERLIWASLHEAGCEINDTLRAEFAKLIWDRGPKHGHFRDYTEEVTPADIAHLAASAQ